MQTAAHQSRCTTRPAVLHDRLHSAQHTCPTRGLLAVLAHHGQLMDAMHLQRVGSERQVS